MTSERLRPLAETDLVGRTRYYRAEGGDELGVRFFNAAITSLQAIEDMPRAGSPRVGELCEIPGLRVRRVEGFPCGWFYLIRDEYVDVVRLLADTQNLPSTLSDLEPR
jgi:toxin ParE1/3/4